MRNEQRFSNQRQNITTADKVEAVKMSTKNHHWCRLRMIITSKAPDATAKKRRNERQEIALTSIIVTLGALDLLNPLQSNLNPLR